MIAFALDRLGLDPAYVIGGEVPQLGGNAGAGEGWLVVEGDESDRTIASLRPRIAVVTNVDLDHHSEFASRAEVAALFDEWLAGVPTVVRADELAPVDGELAVPGEHNRRNAAAALAALEAAGVERERADEALRDFAGVGRRLERRGEAGGVAVYDDYAHNPPKVEAAIEALREDTSGRVLVLFQPHLPSRTRHVARELGEALAGADAVAVTEVYAAREAQVEGVSGRSVVEALVDRRPGMPVAWTPQLEDGVRYLVRRARAGDVVATVGAGDVDAAVPRLLEELA
jgi:UDP-N-acetylmuramate--alanine ligase